MRNVTNNQPAKPDTEPVRRGRGRPRKPDALTNAQRQAAYRQRQQAASINVTVTKNSDRTREVQGLRAELDRASAAAESHKRQAAVLRKQLARAEAELSALKAATAGNESAPGFEVMLKLLAMACTRKPLKAQLVIRESVVWRDGVSGASGVSDEQMRRVAAALAGYLT
jgi:PDZ domain of MCC-2 bdg protein for Usher syndrome